MRVRPTNDGGHLVIATDLALGAGLINAAESLVRACVREFGPQVTVVRHFTAYTMSAFERDKFEVLTPLDEKGIARPKKRTEEVLKLLGAGVVGFPGDAPPGPADADAPLVLPQSVQMARLVAASLRVAQTRVTNWPPKGKRLVCAPPRSRISVRSATILAAMNRLFAGTPQRSSGRLNVSQLAIEASVKRWHLTHQHTDLKDLFQAQIMKNEAKRSAHLRYADESEVIKKRHAELQAHCRDLEGRLQICATALHLLALENAALASRDGEGAKVLALP